MQAVLIAEEEKIEISPIKDSQNLIEITNGYFGWEAQPEADAGKKGTFKLTVLM